MGFQMVVFEVLLSHPSCVVLCEALARLLVAQNICRRNEHLRLHFSSNSRLQCYYDGDTFEFFALELVCCIPLSRF